MISVILPCFNGADTIAIQLDALTRQSWSGPWELVVVNNGSTDASMEIVERYRERLPNLRIVEAYEGRGPRRGVAYSYTVGFAAARGDAFLLCEADDEVGDRWLPMMAEALTRHDLVACAIDYDRLNPAALVDEAAVQTRQTGLPMIGPEFLPFASGCSLGLRRSVYEKVGDPDEACGASWDTDYCWRAQKAEFTLHFVPEAVVHYRLRHSLRARYRQGRSWGEGCAALLAKYRPDMPLLSVLRHQAVGGKRVLRHLAGLTEVARGRASSAFWAWEMGWSVGFLKGGQQLLRATTHGRVRGHDRLRG